LRQLDIREMDTGALLPQKIASMNAYLGGSRSPARSMKAPTW